MAVIGIMIDPGYIGLDYVRRLQRRDSALHRSG
jgi:hypothetical protein